MIDTVLPMQYANPERIGEPHKRLMAAVLRAVVYDCRGGSVYQRSLGRGALNARSVQQAVAYVASRDRAWPYSFENLCEALGVDADALRAALDVTGVSARAPSTVLDSSGLGAQRQEEQ